MISCTLGLTLTPSLCCRASLSAATITARTKAVWLSSRRMLRQFH